MLKMVRKLIHVALINDSTACVAANANQKDISLIFTFHSTYLNIVIFKILFEKIALATFSSLIEL